MPRAIFIGSGLFGARPFDVGRVRLDIVAWPCGAPVPSEEPK